MSLFICYLSEDCFSGCPLAVQVPVLYTLNMSVFSSKTKPASNFCSGCVQFWRTAFRFTERSGRPALCLSSRETDTVPLFKIVDLIRRLLIHPYKAGLVECFVFLDL